MTTMTKRTVATYPTMYVTPTPFNTATYERIASLFEAGVTDGKGTLYYEFEWNGVSNDYVFFKNTRHWVDQAAAEAWKEWLESSSQEYDLNLISVVVEDL